MACVLLIVNSILKTKCKDILEDFKPCTLHKQKWVYEDEKSDIKALLELNDLKS